MAAASAAEVAAAVGAGERMTWRERLDARIDWCPGCDWWRWDRMCTTCAKPVDERLAVVVDATHITHATQEAACTSSKTWTNTAKHSTPP